MKSKALNENNDIFLKNGHIAMTQDGAETLQYVRSRLLFYRGEWQLDITRGLDYFTIFDTGDLESLASAIKTQIIQTDGVEELVSFEIAFNKTTRKASISFEAKTKYGIIQDSEVYLNG